MRRGSGLRDARIVDDQRHVRAFVAKEMVAVPRAVATVVERLAVIGGHDHDGVAREPFSLEDAEDARSSVVDRAHRAVVERADLRDVRGVGRGIGAEPDRLVVLEAPAIRRVRVLCIEWSRRGIRKVRGREEDREEERSVLRR